MSSEKSEPIRDEQAKTVTEKPVDEPAKKGADQPVIEITDLKKSFGDLDVLKGVSLNLYNGENLVVLGKSGTGKSVLIKCVIGLLRGYEGTIKVFDKNITTLTKDEMDLIRQKIGFLFQSGALYDSMTVQQNIEFPLRRINKKLNENQVNEKVIEVLENVGLADSLKKMPSQLSGGMRKRISLARSIVLNPLIMLYDEPTTGLDPVTSDEISLLINDIQKKYKTSSLIITHDIRCAHATADRIIMLKEGEVYKEGKPSEFEKSSDPEIKSFFMEPVWS
jgi:phospholipid/cholesterol/gamma-HCH transport system ATP-binding protein